MAAIDDLPPDMPIPDVCLRYRCANCEGKNLSSRMDVQEFYENIERQKRRRDGDRLWSGSRS